MLIPRSSAFGVLALALILPAARAAEVDPYTPADSEWVLHFNLKQLAGAPAIAKYGAEQLRTGLHGGSDALKPLTALGVDPAKDVHTLTAAGSGLLQFDRALLIVRGAFDAEKLRKAADGLVKEQPAAWKADKQGDVTVYELRDKGRAPAYLAVLTDNTVVLSPGKKYVTAAAALDPKKPAKVSEPLRKLVENADAKDDVWLAALKSDHIQKLLAKSSATSGIADDVTAFTGRLKVGDDARITFSVHTREKKAAEEVAPLLDAAKGFASLTVQGTAGLGPLLSDLIDACKTSTDGGTATLSGRLSEEQIAKALKKK
ncbi:MAG TPA: hypothetical protein VKA46_41685 [Gemmataceae bacterium]|nr:hypothetical protein [Gemmataceae bacterium]